MLSSPCKNLDFCTRGGVAIIPARCFAAGHDLAGEMVRNGYALDWPRYSKGFYADQEAEARENGRGLWAGEFVKPWDWRRR